MFGQNPFNRPIPFGDNHNSGLSGQSQSQSDNSNTNTNTFLPLIENPFGRMPSTTAGPQQSSLFGGRSPSSPLTSAQNKPALFKAPASLQPFAQQGGGGLFGQAACNTPTSPFGRFGAATEQQDSSSSSSSNIIPFAGATRAPKMTHWEMQALVPCDKGDLLMPAHQQSSIDSEVICQIREDMKVLDERVRRLEEHQRSGFGGRR
jgi:hypothetical protein